MLVELNIPLTKLNSKRFNSEGFYLFGPTLRMLLRASFILLPDAKLLLEKGCSFFSVAGLTTSAGESALEGSGEVGTFTLFRQEGRRLAF